MRKVFAGYCQSLLEDGPSRHYLCNPCVGAWTPTPQCPSGALARFFPEDNGLTSDVTGSAHQTTPIMQLQQGILFRGCSHFVMFRLPRSLDPQIAPTAVVLPQGGRAVYTTHSSVGYLPRDVVSLRIRHEQLIRLDFHQLDCSLVGRSDVLKLINKIRPIASFRSSNSQIGERMLWDSFINNSHSNHFNLCPHCFCCFQGLPL